jgi:hypothetical protein
MIFALVLCAMAFPGIFGCQPHADGVKESKLIRHFFLDMSEDDQEREFKNYSLDEQYNLYIWGNQVVHPPAMYLAKPFAQQGPTIVPFLMKKFSSLKFGKLL